MREALQQRQQRQVALSLVWDCAAPPRLIVCVAVNSWFDARWSALDALKLAGGIGAQHTRTLVL